MADSPRVLKAITDRKRKSLLAFLVGPVLKFEMPEQVLIDAATTVLEGARFGPTLADIAKQRTLSSMHGNGQVPWTDEREALEVRGPELQHGPSIGHDRDEVEHADDFSLSVLSLQSAAVS